MKTAKKTTHPKNVNVELRLYMREISKIPLLTAEEEKEMAIRSKNGDREALQKLVEGNLRFVISVAKKYNGCGLALMDLINEGNVGLLEAARRFDPERNVKFTSYAVWWIRQSILMALSSLAHPLRLPPKMANRLYKVNKTVTRRTLELGRKPTNGEIARELQLTDSELCEALQFSAEAASLNQPIDDNGELVLADVLEQKSLPPVDSALEASSLQERVEVAFDSLEHQEEQVLRLRFGLDDDTPRTLHEIGLMLGLSRERIRQIEAKALGKLRGCPQSTSLVNYLN